MRNQAKVTQLHSSHKAFIRCVTETEPAVIIVIQHEFIVIFGDEILINVLRYACQSNRTWLVLMNAHGAIYFSLTFCLPT